MDLKKTSLT